MKQKLSFKKIKQNDLINEKHKNVFRALNYYKQFY